MDKAEISEPELSDCCGNVRPLSALRAGTTLPAAIVVALGLEGPRTVKLQDGEETLLTTIQVGDDSVPLGMELCIWGACSLSLVLHRELDVLHVTNATVREISKTMRLTLSSNGTVTQLSSMACACKASSRAKKVAAWRETAHKALSAVFLSRMPSVSVQRGSGAHASVPKRGQLTKRRVLNVRISDVRIKCQDEGDIADALAKGCVHVCIGCGKTCCSCVNSGRKWQFGAIHLTLHDGERSYAAVAKGPDLGSLLLGADAERVREGGSEAHVAADVLCALAKDRSVMQAVVEEEGNGRLSLRYLMW